MRLPMLRAQVHRTRREILTMGGVNSSDNYREGDLRESRNLSARRWPYITVRRARQRQTGYEGVTALTAWGKLVAVRGTDLLYDGKKVGTVKAGEKQFAVVNTKMVIWPDKVYLDMKSRTVKPLGAAVTGSKATFTANTMKVTGWTDLTTLFHPGDGLTLSGCTTKKENNKDLVVKAVSKDTLTVGDNTFTTCTEASTAIKLERRIPELDFICESENRLWGCSGKEQTLYASALGDPTNFFVYQGLSTDSYALAVGTDGDFTGCCKLSSSVLFWKETRLHKILGSYPAEYSLYTYDIEGLQAGSHKSLQVINEVLFYMGIHGVYAYTGGSPTLISANFGQREFRDAVAGNDGNSYYLSVREGEGRHLFVYETEAGIWVREDETRAVDFARIGKELYLADGEGKVWLCDGGQEDPELQWTAQFCPFYETGKSGSAGGRRRYHRLLLRLELPKGSWVIAETREDAGAWRERGKVLGRTEDRVPLTLGVNRCDKLELRLRGKGPCTVLSIAREYSLGSDV